MAVRPLCLMKSSWQLTACYESLLRHTSRNRDPRCVLQIESQPECVCVCFGEGETVSVWMHVLHAMQSWLECQLGGTIQTVKSATPCEAAAFIRYAFCVILLCFINVVTVCERRLHNSFHLEWGEMTLRGMSTLLYEMHLISNRSVVFYYGGYASPVMFAQTHGYAFPHAQGQPVQSASFICNSL